MAKTFKLPKAPLANGIRVRVSDDLQFCQEFRGATGLVAKAAYKPGAGWLFEVYLDHPVVVRSGNAHRWLRGVQTDDLTVL